MAKHDVRGRIPCPYITDLGEGRVGEGEGTGASGGVCVRVLILCPKPHPPFLLHGQGQRGIRQKLKGLFKGSQDLHNKRENTKANLVCSRMTLYTCEKCTAFSLPFLLMGKEIDPVPPPSRIDYVWKSRLHL